MYRRIALIAIAVASMAVSTNLTAGRKRKILHIDSYHEGYAWSDGIIAGLKKVLRDRYELKIVRMDTKRNTGVDFQKAAGLKVKKIIEDWQPDVVVAADDNAAKYVIEPYYKNAKLPFVFCGLNWDESVYGFPCKNVTGMVEVSLFEQLVKELKPHAKGKRIGHLGPDIVTARKEAQNLKKAFKVDLVDYYAKNFQDWQKGYKEMQAKCDMLIVASDGGLYKDNAAEMKKFVIKEAKIPTGSFYDFMAPYALVSYAKLAEEQGQWAGGAAIRILAGASPKDIKVVRNRRAKIFVNLKIARKLGVRFTLDTLKVAEIIK